MATNNKKAKRVRADRGAGALVLAALALAAMPARAQTIAAPAPAATAASNAADYACTAPAEFARFAYPLRRTAQRLAAGEPLSIVAIGSSSTAGAGATSTANNYPNRLAVELRQRFPAREITVFNRGANGEETQQMLARFATDVLAVHPDLVLWQVGTNSVLRDHPLSPHLTLLHAGIAQLENAGVDVVLMNMQFAPKVLAKPETDGMDRQISFIAKETSVDLFDRFAIMRNWHDVQHMPFEAFVAPDQLHMNDWSYACVAKLLSAAIGEAATRPVASAAVRTAR